MDSSDAQGVARTGFERAYYDWVLSQRYNSIFAMLKIRFYRNVCVRGRKDGRSFPLIFAEATAIASETQTIQTGSIRTTGTVIHIRHNITKIKRAL